LLAQQPPQHPKPPFRAPGHPFRPDSVYFILPNEQTSCRTSKQMTFPVPTLGLSAVLSACRAFLLFVTSIGTSLVSAVCEGNATEILSGDTSNAKILHAGWTTLQDPTWSRSHCFTMEFLIIKAWIISVRRYWECYRISYISSIKSGYGYS